QWCPSAPLDQNINLGGSINPIEFPSVIGRILVVEWWTDLTRSIPLVTPPSGISVSGTTTNNREYSTHPIAISGVPNNAGTYHYTVSTLCGYIALSGTIRVGTPTSITTQPVGQTICQNTALSLSVNATGTNLTYIWEQSPTSDPNDFSSAPGTNNGASYTVNTSTPGTFYYRVTVAGFTVLESNIVQVVIDPLHTISSAPATQTHCQNTDITDIIVTIGGGATGTSIIWSGQSTSPPGTVNSGSSTGNRTIAGNTATATPGTYNWTVTTTPTGGACAEQQTQGSIVVNGVAIGGNPATGDLATTIRVPFSTTTLTITSATGSPTPSIQWRRVPSTYAGANPPTATEGTPASGTNNAVTYTVPDDDNGFGSWRYFAVVSNTCGTHISNLSGLRTVTIPQCAAETGPTNCLATRYESGLTATNFGTPYFRTSQIWTFSNSALGLSQEWSDVVLSPGCNKPANPNAAGAGGFTGGTSPNFNIACRSNRTDGTSGARPASQQAAGGSNYYGDLFSWCAVNIHAGILCPSGWRVPSCQDFVHLDILMGSTGIQEWEAVDMPRAERYFNTSGTAGQFWGGPLGGNCSANGTLGSQGSFGYYWTSTSHSATIAFILYFDTDGWGV
ncbi:MAG: fibrobacter succinogenes major paralogous domain-containing protein, partial [Bacteroidales bacterium]|nr:fibrobacter succinogenes major paralogous domain-containing protein [Bacteroidales bacterium]